MRTLNESELVVVSGGGAWDDMWEYIGEALGGFIAEQAYSKGAKELHDLGSNGGLDDYLAGQNDPLL